MAHAEGEEVSDPLHRVIGDFQGPPAPTQSTHEHAECDTDSDRFFGVRSDGSNENSQRGSEPSEAGQHNERGREFACDADSKEQAADDDEEENEKATEKKSTGDLADNDLPTGDGKRRQAA